MLMRSGNKKKKGLALKFNNLKTQLQLNITESDCWDNIMVGIDKNARKALFLRELEGGDEQKFVDLATIAQCKRISQSHTSSGKGSSQVVDQLGLEFVSKESFLAPVQLEFYNAKNSYLYSIHLELQGKWHNLISESLKA